MIDSDAVQKLAIKMLDRLNRMHDGAHLVVVVVQDPDTGTAELIARTNIKDAQPLAILREIVSKLPEHGGPH